MIKQKCIVMLKKIGIKKWIQMFSSPQETIEKIISIDMRQGIFPLSYLLGFVFLFELAIINRWGNYLSICSLFLLIVILSPIIGYLMINLLSYIIHSLARWINNKAGFLKIRTCFMWSKLPLIGVVILDLILLGVLDETLFSSHPTIFSMGKCYLCDFVLLGKLAFLLWALFTLYQTLHHEQRCSKKKVIFEIIVALLVFCLIVFLIQMPFERKYIHFFDAPTLTILEGDGFKDILLF